MTRYETLKNRLLEIVHDAKSTRAEFKAVCADLFEEMGGETELRALKKASVKENFKGLDVDVDKLDKLNTKIREMEIYKEWVKGN